MYFEVYFGVWRSFVFCLRDVRSQTDSRSWFFNVLVVAVIRCAAASDRGHGEHDVQVLSQALNEVAVDSISCLAPDALKMGQY